MKNRFDGRVRGPGDSGFTLIELLIVIAIIGILASITAYSYQNTVRQANEANAIATLNSIKVAQAKYVIDNQGQYGSFKQLFAEGYLDKKFNFDEPRLRGYVFTLTVTQKSEKRAAFFTATASPEDCEGIRATGKNFYYTDPDNGICFSKTGPATAADASL